jgi:hypothetical protein
MSPPDNGYRDRVVTSLLAADPALVLLRCDEALAVLTGTSAAYRILLMAVPAYTEERRGDHISTE